jgi:tetratricopeptide (TPR) repeat protein
MSPSNPEVIMKKLWFLLLVPVLGLAALLVYQNLPEKRYARHMIKARLYANENNFTAAQMEYEAAYNSTGTFTPYVSLEVLRLMNRKSLQEKNVPQAVANSKDYVRTHPDNKEGRIILSELAFQTGELETAFESIEAVLAQDPGYFPARMLLTQVRTRQGRLDLAEEQLRYLYRKFPDSAETLLPLADNLLKQGKIAEGRQFVNEVLAAHPKNAYSRMLLVDSYLAERNIDTARALLEAWQKEAPPEMARPIAQRRSRLEALSGRFDEAIAVFAPFREIKEENIGILSDLAVIMAAKGDFDSCLALYAALGEAQPRVKAASERMGILIHLKNRNPARALESAKILQLGNKNLELLPLTLAAYLSLGQESKAS